jgi:hypothetical protein
MLVASEVPTSTVDPFTIEIISHLWEITNSAMS